MAPMTEKPTPRRSGRLSSASRSPDRPGSTKLPSSPLSKVSAGRVQKTTSKAKNANVIRRVVEVRYTKSTNMLFIKMEAVDPAGQSDEAVHARQQAFIEHESCLADDGEKRDHLTNLPPPGFSYVDKNGHYSHPDNRFPMLGYRSHPRVPPPPPEHPKIREARRRRTMTTEKAIYYQTMPHHVHVPTAGIPKDENATRRLKPPGPNFPGYQQFLQEQAKLRQIGAGQPTATQYNKNQHNEVPRNGSGLVQACLVR